MKLSEIVTHKNLLDTLSVEKLSASANLDIGSLIEISSRVQLPIEDQLDDLDTARFVLSNILTNVEQTLEAIQHNTQQVIEQQESAYFENSTELYQGMRHEEVDYILDRAKVLDDNTAELINARMKIYTDWRFPGMIIRPGRESHINNMVALDPLYIVDTHELLLEPGAKNFTPEYQARLRRYVIEEYTDNPIFYNLPKQQFGFIFSHNYFQYKPIELIKQYLTEMFDLLRPGGAIAFTYNDCYFGPSVGLTERNFHCYTPGRLIKQHALDQGFDIVFESHTDDNIHWIELIKSGEKDSIRGGQSLAAVVSKNIWSQKKKSKYLSSKLPNDIDIDLDITYTSDEVLKLQISAVLLGIDSEERIFSVYTPEKLYRLVNLRMNQGGIEIDKFNAKLELKFNKRKKS